MGYVLKHWQVLISPVGLVGVLSIFLFSVSGVNAATTGCGSWSVMSSPNVQSKQNFLQGVTVITANDVWNVGFTYDSSGNAFTLTEQWNGTKWNLVASPNTSAVDNFLYGVAGVSANNAWAVGATGSASQGPLQTLIEHWNGTQWSIVSSPNSQFPINQLRGVTAISSSNVWAVGSASVLGGATDTLIEHWNGKKWKVVASPNTTELANYLYSVTAIAANNIWTVGSAASSGGLAAQSLIEHWNGQQWSIVASPNPSPDFSVLNGIAALSAHAIWSTGDYLNTSGNYLTLTEYYC